VVPPSVDLRKCDGPKTLPAGSHEGDALLGQAFDRGPVFTAVQSLVQDIVAVGEEVAGPALLLVGKTQTTEIDAGVELQFPTIALIDGPVNVSRGSDHPAVLGVDEVNVVVLVVLIESIGIRVRQ